MYEGTIWEKIWKVIYPVLIYFFVQLVVRFIASIIISWSYMNSLGNSGAAGAYGYMEGLNTDLGDNAVYVSIISLIITFIIVYRLYVRDGELRIENSSKNLKPGLVIVFGLVMSTGFSRLLSLMFSNNILNTYDEVEGSLLNGNIIAVIIGVGFLAPLVEEFIFRGLVYTRIKAYSGVGMATFISAIMFGVYHFNLPQGMYSCILGIALAFVYEKFKTIWAPVLFHVSANLFSILLTKTGISVLLSSNMLSYVLIMLLELAAGVFLFWLINGKRFK